MIAARLAAESDTVNARPTDFAPGIGSVLIMLSRSRCVERPGTLASSVHATHPADNTTNGMMARRELRM